MLEVFCMLWPIMHGFLMFNTYTTTVISLPPSVNQPAGCFELYFNFVTCYRRIQPDNPVPTSWWFLSQVPKHHRRAGWYHQLIRIFRNGLPVRLVTLGPSREESVKKSLTVVIMFQRSTCARSMSLRPNRWSRLQHHVSLSTSPAHIDYWLISLFFLFRSCELRLMHSIQESSA